MYCVYYLLKWIKFSVKKQNISKILEKWKKNTGKVRAFGQSRKVGTMFMWTRLDCACKQSLLKLLSDKVFTDSWLITTIPHYFQRTRSRSCTKRSPASSVSRATTSTRARSVLTWWKRNAASTTSTRPTSSPSTSNGSPPSTGTCPAWCFIHS